MKKTSLGTNFVISFHPCIEADLNLLIADHALHPRQKELIYQAKAIILPQGCRRDVYWFCRWHCPHVFPNYDLRFPGEGKVGDALLWKSLGLPHPRTVIYPDTTSFYHLHFVRNTSLPFSFPFVLKANRGGEGSMVFLIESQKEIEEKLSMLKSLEKNQNWHGFILQEFIPNQKKDLRVVIIGQRRFFFWRIQREDHWKTNLAQGAVIDKEVSTKVQKRVNPYLDKFCCQTGINLAAIDLLIPNVETPLFLEINYYFGRQALGGSDRFYQLLDEVIKEWLKTI